MFTYFSLRLCALFERNKKLKIISVMPTATMTTLNFIFIGFQSGTFWLPEVLIWNPRTIGRLSFVNSKRFRTWRIENDSNVCDIEWFAWKWKAKETRESLTNSSSLKHDRNSPNNNSLSSEMFLFVPIMEELWHCQCNRVVIRDKRNDRVVFGRLTYFSSRWRYTHPSAMLNSLDLDAEFLRASSPIATTLDSVDRGCPLATLACDDILLRCCRIQNKNTGQPIALLSFK